MSDKATDPIVVVSMACRLPGCDGVADFDDLLFAGRSAINKMPHDRLDLDYYFDAKRGRAGKTYTMLGGCVSDRTPIPEQSPDGVSPETVFDPAHLHFCDVATSAWHSAGLSIGQSAWQNCGVFVGHSGGTALGGPLGLATQIDEALDFLNDIPNFAELDIGVRQRLCEKVAHKLRKHRPRRSTQDGPQYNAYLAASLAARTLQVNGPRFVVDGACASSLMALDHAIMAIRAGRINTAVVGGATYNGADNLILFSQSQACSETGSRPFDDGASGLISSEGYVAVVITTLSRALEHELPIEAVVTGIGVSSDGRGRSLWAPRREGQELALQRAYKGRTPLDIDYLEAHATSTQLGDATELESVSAIAATRNGDAPVRIGSVKSNIGHTLESAGLIGLVKVILSLRRQELPPSINVKSLNKTFDWSQSKINVVTKVQPWTPNGSHRRAGVSAFGIGGLNAHLHVEEYNGPDNAGSSVAANSADTNTHPEPIAIIGRGLVLPGAFDVAAFKEMLRNGRSAIVDAPQTRWRNGIGVDPGDKSGPYRSPTTRGGFITGFEFDGQKYRIPPKQVQQANPIQMMLLDAVRQAVDEFDGGEWSFDRQRTAVVIGTIFGTEFGNNLQIGLRLPEICQEIERQLQSQGANVDAEEISKAFRKVVLKNRPALLDETGSFTASTLASRVAKTFDLMGGAGAVDADDSSGLAALSVAVDKLRTRQVDTIICGAAHRAMDLSAFEELKMNGRLVHSGRIEDVPDDCSRVLPGEGVVTLLLCRQSDAVRKNAIILGTIDNITTGVEQKGSSSAPFDKVDAALVKQIGYLSGSQPLVRLVSETLNWQDDTATNGQSVRLSSRASDGFAIHMTASAPERDASDEAADAIPDMSQMRTTEPLKMKTQKSRQPSYSEQVGSALTAFRIGAQTIDDFRRQLEAAISRPTDLQQSQTEAYAAEDVFRLSLITDDSGDLKTRLEAVNKVVATGVTRRVFDREGAVLWQQTSEVPRVAWLFPGQGSQYAAIPSVVAEDALAVETLAEIDAILDSMGLSPLSPELPDECGRLGKDVWQTQLWVLGVGVALSRGLTDRGLRPDFVLGHSFGEYVGAVTAGVISLEQAVRIIRHRSDAVIMNTRERGVLLSVKGSLNEVDAALRESGLPLTITHNNSPSQTVVAGPEDAIKAFRKSLSKARLASIIVPVPAPFHTSMLSDAETAMQRAVSGEKLQPPSCGFLSATCGQFLAEPEAIRSSMVTQLTKPVLYQPSVRRLIDANSHVLLEVGPNDVLTRLNREIVANDAVCLSLDVPGQTYHRRMSMVDLVMDCIVSKTTQQHPTQMITQSAQIERAVPAAATVVNEEIEIVDVTRSRKRKSEDGAKPQNGHAAKKRVVSTITAVTEEPKPAAVPSPEQSSLVRRFLLDLVVELTGYDRDILDFDADLEAELGLDSIKKAQIIGELAEWADLKVAANDLRLADISSLADIAALAADSELPNPDAGSENEWLPAPVIDDASPLMAAADSDLSSTVANLLINFVVDLTGYDRKIVDLDADLEGELGLDSIKIAQIVGEMQEQFELREIRADQLSLGDFRTLRSIQSFLVASIEKQSGTVTNAAPMEFEPIAKHEPPVESPSYKTLAKTPLSNGAEILGVAPNDELPDDWAELFQARSDAETTEAAWQDGFDRGTRHRPLIRAALRLLVDTDRSNAPQNGSSQTPVWNELAEQEMRGLSSGAGVVLESVRFAASVTHHEEKDETTVSVVPSKRPEGTHRFALRMTEAPRRAGMPTQPVLQGAALILGSSELSSTLAERIRDAGQLAHIVADLDELEQAEAVVSKIWQDGPTPHLFILTPFDEDAISELDARAWEQRRTRALEIPFRVCQLWMQNVIDAELMEDATVVACSRLGGDLGFSGNDVQSPESLAGLVKAMLIECWMREFRTTPMKVVDIAPSTSSELAVDGILNELAVPSYDMEVSVSGDDRLSVQAYPAPLVKERNGSRKGREITRGGTWVVSGGGRGITAMTAMALAERNNLKLHLLGTAPVPNVSESMREAARHNRSQVRRQVMAGAPEGENPVELWRNTEKAIEIDITLQECQRRGARSNVPQL